MKKCITYSKDRASASLTVRTPTTPHCKRLIFHPHDWCQTFPFQQFQVLFNSLFKVLFIFPSRYLFAIGLAPIFSFRWNLPPTLRCSPKQRDSKKTCRTRKLLRYKREYHPRCCPLPRNLPRIAALTSPL